MQNIQNKKLLNNFGVLNSQEWAIMPKQDVLILVNNYTIDQFVYEKLSLNSWHLMEIYKSRAQYTIPNTPQVILATHQTNNSIIQMLVQSAPFQLDRIFKKGSCETSLQELIKNVLKIIQYLVKKYGFFRITKDMIKVTRSCNIIVWMHEKFSQIHRQYPLNSRNIYQDDKIMINDLLDIFQAIGFTKQLQNLRNKIQVDKIVSFQKFKIILENKVKCYNKCHQNSGKFYRHPQFLKNKNSPDNINRASTQYFVQKISHNKQTRFATSVNLGVHCLNLSAKNQKTQNLDEQLYAQKRVISNKPSTKSIHFNHSKPNLHQSDINQQKQSCSNFKINIYQANLENVDIKNKNVRDSGNSFSTTAFLNSITSSGKFKLNSFDQHNFCSTPKQNDSKALASSVGNKQTKNIKQLKQTFKVKESKIIEQKNQQLAVNTLQSFIKGQNELESDKQQDLQKNLDGLLNSLTSSNQKPSSSLVELQNEIFNILFS